MSVSFRFVCPAFVAFAISEFCTEYCNKLIPEGDLSEEERSKLEKYCHADTIFSMTLGCAQALREHISQSIGEHIGESSVAARMIIECFAPILTALDKQIARAGSYRPIRVNFPKYENTHMSGYCSGHIGAEKIDCPSCNDIFLACCQSSFHKCDQDCDCVQSFDCNQFCQDCQRNMGNYCPCQEGEEVRKAAIETLKAKLHLIPSD